jgi:hypothetical protein
VRGVTRCRSDPVTGAGRHVGSTGAARADASAAEGRQEQALPGGRRDVQEDGVVANGLRRVAPVVEARPWDCGLSPTAIRQVHRNLPRAPTGAGAVVPAKVLVNVVGRVGLEPTTQGL